MNSFTLKFCDANLESQYQKEISPRSLIKLTRLMFLENFFLIIFQTQQLIVKEHNDMNAIILGLCTLLILTIVFLNRISSLLLFYVLIINYLGLNIFYIEMIHLSKNSMGLENAMTFVIPFQVLHSIMIYVR